MARYLLTFRIQLLSARQQHAVEQSEERIVNCEPNELAGAISAEKRALEARVNAAVDRIDPSGSSRIALERTRCI